MLAEGDYNKALQLLNKGRKHYSLPLINSLGAAFAAQCNHDTLLRNELLQEASKTNPGAKLAISITQAQLQLLAQEYEQAYVTLRDVLDKHPNHPLTLKLIVKALMHLKDFKQAYTFLPKLQKTKMLPDERYYKIVQELIAGYLKRYPIDDCLEFWQSLPERDKQLEANVCIMLEQLSKHDCIAETIKIAQKWLQNHYSNKVWQLLSKLNGKYSNELISLCDKYLKNSPHAYEILLCRGMHQSQLNHYKLAASDLQKCLDTKPESSTLLLLSAIYQRLGDLERAKQLRLAASNDALKALCGA